MSHPKQLKEADNVNHRSIVILVPTAVSVSRVGRVVCRGPTAASRFWLSEATALLTLAPLGVKRVSKGKIPLNFRLFSQPSKLEGWETAPHDKRTDTVGAQR